LSQVDADDSKWVRTNVRGWGGGFVGTYSTPITSAYLKIEFVEKEISIRDSPLGNQNLLFLHPKLVREYPGPTTQIEHTGSSPLGMYGSQMTLDPTPYVYPGMSRQMFQSVM
jgi:hypothetical protein